MKDLALKINLNQELTEKVLSVDINRVEHLAAKCCSNFAVLSRCDDIERLAVCLYYAVNYTFNQYLEKGIPLDIFYDTMCDITIWCENNDNCGLKNYNWIKNHLNLQLFKLGRLQFQLYNCESRFLKYDLLPFDKGDNMIYVHIPQGEKLIYSKCIESLLDSKEFFNKYFMDFEFDYYFCESWLLYSENYAFMNPSCNILQFQSLFSIIFSAPIGKQAIERIFGKKQLIKSRYPEFTTLQRQAKHYLLDGNKLGFGIGIIDRNDI